jgi:hypothetical protein
LQQHSNGDRQHAACRCRCHAVCYDVARRAAARRAAILSA